jgi:hypothetical protein
MSAKEDAVREHSLVVFGHGPGVSSGGVNVWSGRGQNFLVDWVDVTAAGAAFRSASEHEAMLLFPDMGGQVRVGRTMTAIPPRAVCILPAGAFEATLNAPGLIVALFSDFSAERASTAGNAAEYVRANARVAPVDTPYHRASAEGARVIEVDRIEPAAGRPRLKMIQSATMSINWVEYEGERDRTKLSPHSHEDFEQGSLAIHGAYLNHLRLPWGPDATAWREDLHVGAPEKSLTVIPPGIIHTTEGVGPGRHLLIDIFAPARADFIEKGWIANSGDYRRAV